MVNTQIILSSVSLIVLVILAGLTYNLYYSKPSEGENTNNPGEYYIQIPPNILTTNGSKNIDLMNKNDYNSVKLLSILIQSSKLLKARTEALNKEIEGFNSKNLKPSAPEVKVVASANADPNKGELAVVAVAAANAIAEAPSATNAMFMQNLTLAKAKAANELFEANKADFEATATKAANKSLNQTLMIAGAVKKEKEDVLTSITNVNFSTNDNSLVTDSVEQTARKEMFPKNSIDYDFNLLDNIDENTLSAGSHNKIMVLLATEFQTANSKYNINVQKVTIWRTLYKEDKSRPTLSEFYRYYAAKKKLKSQKKVKSQKKSKSNVKSTLEVASKYKNCIFTKVPVARGEKPIVNVITDNELCGRISNELDGPSLPAASKPKSAMKEKKPKSAMKEKKPKSEMKKAAVKKAAEEFYYYY